MSSVETFPPTICIEVLTIVCRMKC